MTWCHYGRKPCFTQDVTDLWNITYFRKNCYAENKVLLINAAKCWFGEGDHAKNCRGIAATLCHHGSGSAESTASSFEDFPFRRTAVQNFVTGWYVIHTGDVTHEDSYGVCPVPCAAATLQATPALNLIMQIGQFADPSRRAVWGVSLRPLCWECGIESRRSKDVCLLRALCFFRYRSLRRACHSSGGVLPNVLYQSMISKPQQWGGLGPLGLSNH